MRPEGGAVIGGCRVLRELGRGGMGVVYLAEEERLRRRVALKVISPELAQDVTFRHRFARESRLAAAIDHPNAVPVFSAGEDQGLLFLVMRYVDGTDLRSALAGEGKLEPARASRIVGQISSALDAAHAAGLVHRDIKPANVLLTGSGDQEHAYLSDFGLTKDVASQSQLTQSGHWLGTVDYAAPEQLEGGPTDARADVYSLGCVLFELLSGQVPYQGTLPQKLWSHMHRPPPSLATHAPNLTAAFDPVIHRAMAKDPSARFRSAGDLGRAARAAAAGTAITEPERTVATGDAAPSSTPTTPPPGPAPRPAPTYVDNDPPPSPPTAAATVRQRRRGPRLSALMAGGALLILGLAGGIAVGTGALDSSAPEQTESSAGERSRLSAAGSSKAERRNRKSAPQRTRTTTVTVPAEPPEPAPAAAPTNYRQYSSTRGGFATELPTDSGWSVGAMTNENTARNPRYHVEVLGPGVEIWIESTPADPATAPTSGVLSRSSDTHPQFGPVEVVEFRTGSSPCTERCVDYVIQTGESSGLAVLAGGTDPALAKKVASRIVNRLGYFDY